MISNVRTDFVAVLQDLADGLTLAESAKKHGVSYQALKNRMRLSREKKKAQTSIQLVALAIREGKVK